ncbi:MAG: hypothetical protein HY332_25360 [Chloroflexi bacterium]|nr:hypothetical protein [Chloroflexota bacterium]
MFLVRFLFWLLTLPIRLVFWVIGLALWVFTLPLRIVFLVLGLIGFGRILQLGALAAAGYYLYRLLSGETQQRTPSTIGTTTTDPSTAA